MSEDLKLRLDDVQLDKMLKSSSGEVGRHLTRIGNVVLLGARRMVGVRRGRLRASLKIIRHDRYSRGQLIEVGSRLHYAYLHHEGTHPHTIRPKSGRVLAFNKGGRITYARVVHHPGTRGRKYLTIPLRSAVR